MKKIVAIFVFSFILLILTIKIETAYAQDDLPWIMDQHGSSGDQSPQGAPLDGGTDILALLGIAYAAKKVSDLRKKCRISW